MSCPVPEGTIEIKTGDNGQMTHQYTDNQDPPVPIPLDNYEIHISYIDPKTRVPVVAMSTEAGNVIITDTVNGLYNTDPGSTWDWPLGKMPVDILYINNGVPQHTDNFIIHVKKGNTL